MGSNCEVPSMPAPAILSSPGTASRLAVAWLVVSAVAVPVRAQCTDADFDGFCAGTDDCTWSRRFAGCDLQPEGFRPTPDGGFVLGASVGEPSCGGPWARAYMMKLDGLGRVEWQRLYDPAARVNAVHTTPDGGYVLTTVDAQFGTFPGPRVWKLDAAGDVEWVRRLEGEVYGGAEAVPLGGGGYLVGADGPDPGGQTLVRAIRLDASGAELWQTARELATTARLGDVAATSDGGAVLVSRGCPAWVLRVAADGSTPWAAEATVSGAGCGSGWSWSIEEQLDPDGGYLLGERLGAASFGLTAAGAFEADLPAGGRLRPTADPGWLEWSSQGSPPNSARVVRRDGLGTAVFARSYPAVPGASATEVVAHGVGAAGYVLAAEVSNVHDWIHVVRTDASGGGCPASNAETAPGAGDAVTVASLAATASSDTLALSGALGSVSAFAGSTAGVCLGCATSDCDDGDPGCTTSCTSCADADGDGVVMDQDCDDGVATCVAPPGGDFCGDSDFDGHGACAGDCDDSDARVGRGFIERNDGTDNQCPGDAGHGLVDEVAGPLRFVDATTLCWPGQLQATGYHVAWCDDAPMATGCLGAATSSTCLDTSSELPAPGGVDHYLVRSTGPFWGSWGAVSTGPERTVTGFGTCGDGVRNTLEDCDDGSTLPGDGCSPSCAEEPAWTCYEEGPADPSPGLSHCFNCTMDSGACVFVSEIIEPDPVGAPGVFEMVPNPVISTQAELDAFEFVEVFDVDYVRITGTAVQNLNALSLRHFKHIEIDGTAVPNLVGLESIVSDGTFGSTDGISNKDIISINKNNNMTKLTDLCEAGGECFAAGGQAMELNVNDNGALCDTNAPSDLAQAIQANGPFVTLSAGGNGTGPNCNQSTSSHPPEL